MSTRSAHPAGKEERSKCRYLLLGRHLSNAAESGQAWLDEACFGRLSWPLAPWSTAMRRN